MRSVQVSRKPQAALFFAAALLLTLPYSAVTKADLFRYKDGRIIYGKVAAEPAEGKTGEEAFWAVEIDDGVFVKILKSELALRGHEPLSEKRLEYAELIMNPSLIGDQGLAAFSSKHGLSDLTKAQREYAVDLDPDDKPARIAADYDRDTDGRWQRKNVLMGYHRGKVKIGSSWRFPESVAVEKKEKENKDKIAQATKEMRRWHAAAINVRSKQSTRADALRKISLIDDHLTTGAIAEYLLDQRGLRKPLPEDLRMTYVHVLANLRNPAAAGALAQVSIRNDIARVRNSALDALNRYGREIAIPTFLGFLGNPENIYVNRAADGLALLKDETTVLPLIRALNTEHTKVIGKQGMNANTSGSMTFGGDAKPVTVTIENQAVLSTLSLLTGKDFGFNETQWMAWYASVFARPARDLRRDY